MSPVLIRSANIMHDILAPWPRQGYRNLMSVGIVLLLGMILVTAGCAGPTVRQRSSSRGGVSSARQNAPIRSKARAPVTPPKPTAPPQGEEEGGRIF